MARKASSATATVVVRSKTLQIINYGGRAVTSVEDDGDFIIVNHRKRYPKSRVIGFSAGDSAADRPWATVLDFYERSYTGEVEVSADEITVTPERGNPASFLINDANFVLEIVSGAGAEAEESDEAEEEEAPRRGTARPRTSRGDVPEPRRAARDREPAKAQRPAKGKQLTVREQRALRKAEREAEARAARGKGRATEKPAARSAKPAARAAKPAAKPARPAGKPSKRKPAVW